MPLVRDVSCDFVDHFLTPAKPASRKAERL